MGPYNPNEWLMVLLVPFVLTGLTMAVLFSTLRYWTILFIFFYMWALQKQVLKLKKNKSKSWFFDLCHRIRAVPLDSAAHFARPKITQVYDGTRRLIGGSWTRASRSVMVPTRPEHLTIGLPAVQIYNPKTKTLGPSITPQFQMDGYCIMMRTYVPGKAPIPHHWRNAVFARDANGIAAIQNYARVVMRWRPGKAGDKGP